MTQLVQIEYLRWVGNEVVRTIVGQVCIGSSTSTEDLEELENFIKSAINAYNEKIKQRGKYDD